MCSYRANSSCVYEVFTLGNDGCYSLCWAHEQYVESKGIEFRSLSDGQLGWEMEICLRFTW